MSEWLYLAAMCRSELPCWSFKLTSYGVDNSSVCNSKREPYLTIPISFYYDPLSFLIGRLAKSLRDLSLALSSFCLNFIRLIYCLAYSKLFCKFSVYLIDSKLFSHCYLSDLTIILAIR